MAGKFSVETQFGAVDNMSGPMGSMATKATMFERALGRANKVADKGVAFAKAFTTGAVVAGAGAAVAFNAFVGASNEVEDSLAKVASVVTPMSGTIVDATARAKKAALDWSKAHKDSATKFLDTTYMMISAGLSEQAALEGTRTALQVSTATFGDGAAAASLLATLYNNMGDKAADVSKEIGWLGDVVTKTQQTFQFADLNQLNEGLKYGIPAALQYGMSIEELSTVIGVLNNAGLQGSMAGTAFGASMRNMAKASKELGFAIAKTSSGGVDFTGTVKNLETKFGALATMTDANKAKLQKAFGDEGFRGLSLMIGKSGDLVDGLKKVRDNANAAGIATAGIESKGSARWQILANRVEAVKVGVGDGLAPAAERLLGVFGRVIGATDDWTSANGELIGSRLGAKIDEWIPLVEKFGAGLEAGFKKAEPAISAAGNALSFVFGGGGEDPASRAEKLGNQVGTLAVRFGEFWLATKAVTAATTVWSFVTGTAKAIGVLWSGVVWGAKAAMVAYEIWTNAGTASTIAIYGASLLAKGQLIAQRTAAIASAGGMKILSAASWAASAPVLAVAAAIAAVVAAGYELFKLANENGGIEGLAGMVGVGTKDWGFAGVDEVMNRQAKAEAARRKQGGGDSSSMGAGGIDGLASLQGIAALQKQLQEMEKLSGQMPPGQTPTERAGNVQLPGMPSAPMAPTVEQGATVVKLQPESTMQFSRDMAQQLSDAISRKKGIVEIRIKDPGKNADVTSSGDPLMSLDPSGAY